MWRDCVKGSVVRRLALACCVGIVSSAAACGSGSEPSAPSAPSAAAVIITPSTMNLTVGARFPLQAEVQDASGQPLRDATIFWSSSDTTIASVSSAGVVSARTVGAVQIAASVGLKSAVATLDVVPVPVASVAILPPNGTIPVGATLALSAVTYDSVGTVLTGRQVLWATSAPQIARVSASGVVTGVTAGAATITATSEGRSGGSAVTVTAVATTPPATPPPVASITLVPGSGSITVGQGTQAVATLKDAQGNVLSGRTIAYNSSDPAVATVASTGFVTAVKVGTAIITAASEGKSASATVTVTAPAPPAVATVTLSLNSSSISIGQSTQANATVRDAQGDVLTGRVITYNSSNTSVATVSSSGLVTAVAPGTSTITATSEGETGAASVTVPVPPPAPVASVSVSPDSGSILVDSTLALTATTRDSSGATLTGRTIIWSSDLPQVASVSASGVVTANAAGRATITATSEGKSDSAVITVSAPTPVASVVVTPAFTTMQTNSSINLTAEVFDADGNVLTGRTITWSTSNSVVSVTPIGATATVTATGNTGPVLVTATSEGQQGSSGILVTP